MDLQIKKIRNQKGISQLELANMIGVKERTIQQYESGNITPPLDKIEKLSLALNVSESELLGLEVGSSASLRELLLPKDKKCFDKLKQFYGLMYQFKNGSFFPEEEIEKKILSVGFDNFRKVINSDELELMNGLLLIANTLKDYIEDDEMKEDSIYYKTFKDLLKSFKYLDVNGDINNKL